MKISIITVCYNAEATIVDTIKSVAAQKYPYIEHILVDGGSNDKTVEYIKKYEQSIAAFVSEPDQGIYDAMNKGISMATGDVIGILNSDDFFACQDVLSKIMAVFEARPNVSVVMGNVDYVRDEDLFKRIRHYTSQNFSVWKMRFGFMPAHPATFIKKEIYLKEGGYKLGYKSAADFEMFVRLFMVKRIKYLKINLTIVRMRIGGVSTSGVESYIVTTKEILKALNDNAIYSNLFFVLLRLPIKAFFLFFNKLFLK